MPFSSLPSLSLWLAALCAVGGALAATPEGDPELGRRLYLEGLTAAGTPVTALTQGDIEVSGRQFNCAGCHRRSGYGSSEGGVFVPPITAGFLFEPRKGDRAFLFRRLFQESQPRRFWARIREPHARPAYDLESLGRVLRSGVTPGGQRLDPIMPRYRLGAEDMANLHAYLRTLSAHSDPGVDERNIYLATVVSDGVDPEARAAMLQTIAAFVRWMNLDTQGDLRNPYFSPGYRSDLIAGYRIWKLQVWELHGPPQGWPQQLRAYYRERPVFALVSGLVEGPWDPVHRFCEARGVPCLFPNTDLPDTTDPAYETVYLHRGLEGEAEVLAEYLHDYLGPGLRVVQLTGPGAAGTRPAGAFRARFARLGEPAPVERTLGTGGDPPLPARDESGQGTPPVVVAWPGAGTGALWPWLERHAEGVGEIYLPSTALEGLPDDLPAGLRERLYFAYPYELPSGYHPRAFRVRAWMRTRGLEIDHPRLQFDTYFALTVVQYGLNHIVDKFSRDYLIEYVEHEVENALNPGTYPRLSLGPGQRFASKGAFVVQPGRAPGQRVTQAGSWRIP